MEAQSVLVWLKCYTWTQRVTGQFLDGLTLTDGSSVQRRRVGAAARPLLIATPTATATHRPLGPRRPAAVHCTGKEAGDAYRRQTPNEF